MAKPVVLAIGMAGSGKTTFIQRLQADMSVSGQNPYVINLDAAVLDTPYESNLDIRDTVDYKTVMSEYGLGPNGAILTALNLYSTKWDQVLDLLESRQAEIDLVMVDTPGQIEIFTWSASGAIISESCASLFPTCIAYIVDTVQCASSPICFMSNMLYACSIMYKYRLPFILVLNKTDITPADRIVTWLTDYFAFQAALDEHQKTATAGAGYMASLMQSMGLVLEEFYQNITAIPVSAFTGDGMDAFHVALTGAVKEYETEYKPDLERRATEREMRKLSLSNKDNKD